ncbi:uncharacterized protein LOC114829948 [Esox lucius]|uniref:uncharacterized protein LOC114829948 n=1 Tax=Esox lucius TaxID=8010 RepID=UPI001477081C|nr:uncharacterized protein LOC114829948 [Esox lucius]
MGKAADRQEQLREGMERIVPEQLWSQHDTDVGLVKSASPVFIKIKPGAKPVWKRQYHMKPEAVAGIEPTIEGLAEADVLEETVSDCNTPLFPVLKADKQKWRLVHDLRPINDIVEDCLAEVPNPHTLLTNIPPEAKFFSVIDLCGAFFSVPLAVECRHLFAFTYGGKQYRYTRLPQGFKHSPHIFNQVLKADLEELVLEGTLLQYVDDLLICAPTLEQCHADSIKVLQRLAEGGHKVSRKKLQYCQTEVEYLGRTIAHQTKAISPTQLEGLSSAPLPQTVSQMMTFLGMTGFSSDWIEDYALKVSPLRGLMKEVGQQQLSAKLHWNCDALAAFETIKQDMQSAPALGTPDYTKPFLLYVANRAEGYASAVLMQDTCSGRRKQPIAYYSTKLDSVAQGYPPCYQGLAAVQYAYDKASTITMGYPVIIHTHHKVTELIERGKFVLTNARLLDYLPLLTYPDITIKKCTTVNPAERIPLEFEGEPHDCVAESLTFTRLRPDLLSLPIPGAEEELFVDGSCYRDIDGNHAGFAVVRMDSQGQFHTIVSQTCPQPCSAQLAELKALTAACREGEGKVANIYTDSAYAHGVCNLFGAVWKQRGFKKTDGSPILHHEHIQDLMGSLLLPRQVAIVKCQAHRKGNSYIIQGNNAVDEAAKLASKCHSAILAPLILVEAAPVMSDVIRMQEMANVYEKQLWLQRGATTDAAGLWRTHTGLLVAPTALLRILINNAHGFDHCARGEIMRMLTRQGFWSPYMQATVDVALAECAVCAKNNIRKGMVTPLGHIPTPEGPFRHLVMDYVDMIRPIYGKRYMLVVIDRFSRWIEATPSKDQGAGTVIKFLTREVMPRFGIPTEISSDNGSAFIQRTLKQVIQHLNIKQRLGCVYHPQSQGMVERANGTLKAKISKICASAGLNWVDALPIALMSCRMETNRTTHLTPHEMLTGRPMPVPVLRGPHEGPPLEQLELEFREYIRQLTTIHELIHKQEKARVPEPEDDQPRAVVPGNQVYIKVYRRRWNEPRREGPYRVTQATTTAVRVEGSDTWYHLNHCTKVPQGVGQHEEDENADLPGGSESQEGEGVAPSAPEELVPQPEKSEPSRKEPDVGVENAHAQSAVDSSGAMVCVTDSRGECTNNNGADPAIGATTEET